MVNSSLRLSYHVLKPIVEGISPPVRSQQSTASTPSIRVQPPSLPNIGDTDPAPLSAATRSRTTPAATVSNALGPLRSPFENTQEHAIRTGPPPSSRVYTPATANDNNSPFSFNFQYPKTSDPTPATPDIQPTDNSPSLENRQHHPSSQTFIVPPNPALRDSSHSAGGSVTAQSAPHSSSGIAGPVRSIPQAELKRKVADVSSDSSQKRRMTSNSRAPQTAQKSNHPLPHPTSSHQLSSGPSSEPRRHAPAPQSALRFSHPPSHPTPIQQLFSGPTNEPVYPHMNVNPVIPTDARSTAAPAPSVLQAELKQKVAGGSNDISQESGSIVGGRTSIPQPSSRPTSRQQAFQRHTDSHMTGNSPVPLNAPLPPNTTSGRSYSLPPGVNLPVQINTAPAPFTPAPVPFVNRSPALRPSPYPMSSQQLPSGHSHTDSHIDVNFRANSDPLPAPSTVPGKPAPN